MPICNIYKNLWAGYDCYFIRMHTNGRMATGIMVHNAYGDWRVAYNTQFYAQDMKDAKHFPIVGKIDINQSIISAVLVTVEGTGGEIVANDKPLDTAKKIIKEHYKDYDCGIFNTTNKVGDPMTPIYKDDSIEILGCYYYSYFEVFGLSRDDFDRLEDYYNGLEQEAR